jgi:hypothetical protein
MSRPARPEHFPERVRLTPAAPLLTKAPNHHTAHMLSAPTTETLVVTTAAGLHDCSRTS